MLSPERMLHKPRLFNPWQSMDIFPGRSRVSEGSVSEAEPLRLLPWGLRVGEGEDTAATSGE